VGDLFHAPVLPFQVQACLYLPLYQLSGIVAVNRILYLTVDFWQGKQPVCEADSSFPFSAVDNNVWRHCSVPPYVFIGGCHTHDFVYFQRSLWQIFANQWRHCSDNGQHRNNYEIYAYSTNFGIVYSFFLPLFLSGAYLFYVLIVISRGLLCT